MNDTKIKWAKAEHHSFGGKTWRGSIERDELVEIYVTSPPEPGVEYGGEVIFPDRINEGVPIYDAMRLSEAKAEAQSIIDSEYGGQQ